MAKLKSVQLMKTTELLKEQRNHTLIENKRLRTKINWAISTDFNFVDVDDTEESEEDLSASAQRGKKPSKQMGSFKSATGKKGSMKGGHLSHRRTAQPARYVLFVH